MDPDERRGRRGSYFGTTLDDELRKYKVKHPKELLQVDDSIHYLEDESIEVSSIT